MILRPKHRSIRATLEEQVRGVPFPTSAWLVERFGVNDLAGPNFRFEQTGPWLIISIEAEAGPPVRYRIRHGQERGLRAERQALIGGDWQASSITGFPAIWDDTGEQQ